MTEPEYAVERNVDICFPAAIQRHEIRLRDRRRCELITYETDTILTDGEFYGDYTYNINPLLCYSSSKISNRLFLVQDQIQTHLN